MSSTRTMDDLVGSLEKRLDDLTSVVEDHLGDLAGTAENVFDKGGGETRYQEARTDVTSDRSDV